MTKATAPNSAPAEEYVDFLIPRVTPDDRPVFLGVNGESVRVVPGETVRVRRAFAEVWASAQAQTRAAWETCARAQEASRKALANL